MKVVVRRIASSVALLAAATWLGGLVALGAIAAPVVFSVAPWPASADAMTIVFRRFDGLAMACASIVVATEAVRAAARMPFARADIARTGVAVLAAAAAVVEGVVISPRIAALHVAGAIRGVGGAGVEMGRLHDLAEACGQAEVVLLAVYVVLQVLTLSHGGPLARVDAGSAET
ncbi:MAG: DUF4149 domain-containing protein [Polyangiaceae bacterium]